MKNIHLILVNKSKASLYHCSNTRNFFTTRQTPDDLLYEMYITNDEEIKVGDWVLFENTNNIRKSVDSTFTSGVNNIRIYADKKVFKIILTTDGDLIKDGIQAIDDKFLEWFVKNPSCEKVEVEFIDKSWEYKTIIPSEEPKANFDRKIGFAELRAKEMVRQTIFGKQQETIEEAAERLAYDSTEENKGFPSMKRFIEGAKWIQERSYSEENVNIMFNTLKENSIDNKVTITNVDLFISSWKEELKNK